MVLSQKSCKFHYKTQKPITDYIFAFESPLSFLISSFSSRLLVIFFIFVDFETRRLNELACLQLCFENYISHKIPSVKFIVLPTIQH